MQLHWPIKKHVRELLFSKVSVAYYDLSLRTITTPPPPTLDTLQQDPGRSLVRVLWHEGGVDWLHMRLDKRPKYYRHLPWREWVQET
jgi:hypothetical protein